MHRQATSIRTSDEYINIPMVSVKRSSGTRKSTDNNSDDDDELLLPLYISTSSSTSINGSSKKETSTSRSRFSVSEKWIHIIPLIVFISVLILYWFSHPVDVQLRDGRIVTIRQMQVPEQLKNNTNGNQTKLSSSATVPKEMLENVEIKLLTSKTMPMIKTNITSKALQIKTNTTSKAMQIKRNITSKAI
ncbi:hypothetical protein MKX01_013303 [Papaver californicum]|nr:hypothetical protein MKX01_013303 [Papaver californicum]